MANFRIYLQVVLRYPNLSSKHHLDPEEIELPLESYRSFNAFFSRRLKPDARPFNTDPDVFCAPADGKVLAYPQLQAETQIPIKGDSISIESLFSLCSRCTKVP
ncbi:MAG: hypothetical protein HC770_02285 [Pseudanabaena sp. CRU_2_10]|nr:hypothetical protein [Pseudanabaena sp. CRU_2_10]